MVSMLPAEHAMDFGVCREGAEDPEESTLRDLQQRNAQRRHTESDVERRRMRESYEATLRHAGVYVPVPISMQSYGQAIQSHKGKERMLSETSSTSSSFKFPPPGAALRPGMPFSGGLSQYSNCNSNSNPSDRALLTPSVTPQHHINHAVGVGAPPSLAADGSRSFSIRDPAQQVPQQLPVVDTDATAPAQGSPVPAELKITKVEIINSPQPLMPQDLPRCYHTLPPPPLAPPAGPTNPTLKRPQSMPASLMSGFARGGKKLSNEVEQGYWFPDGSKQVKRVAYSEVQQVQKALQSQQYTVLFPSQIAMVEVPTKSPEGLQYLDYTYNESALLALRHPAYEKLTSKQGAHHVELKWCSRCENVAKHRQRAWDILLDIMREFPGFDYCHSLPSELCSEHQKELARSTLNHSSGAECSEIYCIFTPRGGATRSLKVVDKASLIAALHKVLQALPRTNMLVTLLNARNVEPKRSFLLGTKSNPFVQFSVVGDNSTPTPPLESIELGNTSTAVGTESQQPDSNLADDNNPLRSAKDGKRLMSRFVPGSNNPDFAQEKFSFLIQDPAIAELKMEILNCLPGKKEYPSLGWATLSLKQLRLGEALRVTAELQGSKLGTISVVLQAEGAPFLQTIAENTRASYHVNRSGAWALISPRGTEDQPQQQYQELPQQQSQPLSLQPWPHQFAVPMPMVESTPDPYQSSGPSEFEPAVENPTAAP